MTPVKQNAIAQQDVAGHVRAHRAIGRLNGSVTR